MACHAVEGFRTAGCLFASLLLLLAGFEKELAWHMAGQVVGTVPLRTRWRINAGFALLLCYPCVARKVSRLRTGWQAGFLCILGTGYKKSCHARLPSSLPRCTDFTCSMSRAARGGCGLRCTAHDSPWEFVGTGVHLAWHRAQVLRE